MHKMNWSILALCNKPTEGFESVCLDVYSPHPPTTTMMMTTKLPGPGHTSIVCVEEWYDRTSSDCQSEFGVCFDLYAPKWLVKRNPEKYNAHISYKGCIEDFTWVSRMST